MNAYLCQTSFRYSADGMSILTNTEFNVKVNSSGHVKYTFPARLKSWCNNKDANCCNITMQSWSLDEDYLDLRLSNSDIDVSYFEDFHNTWSLVSATATTDEKQCCHTGHSRLIYTVCFERKPDFKNRKKEKIP